MTQTGLEDSKDPWRYVIILSKFLLLVVFGGIIKAFGVLIPEMVTRYNSDYKTIAFICGLPSFVFVTAPIVNLLMKVTSPRKVGIVGGLLTAVSIVCAAFAHSVYILGMMLVLTGFGITLVFLPVITSVNNFFRKSFIFVNAVTQFGTTFGALAVPLITERSLDAYGYHGAFLILGGISLHAVVSAVCIRPPMDLKKEGVLHEVDDLIETRKRLKTYPAEKNVVLPHEKTSDLNDQTGYDTKDSSDLNAKKHSTSSVLWNFYLSTRHFLMSSTIITEPLFTLLIPGLFLEGYVLHSWMLFLVPHAECVGTIRSQAVFMSTIAGIGGILAETFFVVLLYLEFYSTLIFCFACLVCATSFFISPVSATFTFLAVMSLLQGFCMFLIRCFPPAGAKLAVKNEKSMQSAFSWLLFVQAVGHITGDTISGHVYDVTSSCSTLFISFGVILVAVSGNFLIFFLVNQHSKKSHSEHEK